VSHRAPPSAATPFPFGNIDLAVQKTHRGASRHINEVYFPATRKIGDRADSLARRKREREGRKNAGGRKKSALFARRERSADLIRATPRWQMSDVFLTRDRVRASHSFCVFSKWQKCTKYLRAWAVRSRLTSSLCGPNDGSYEWIRTIHQSERSTVEQPGGRIRGFA